MKTQVTKNYVLQAHASDAWRPVAEYPETGKKEALGLLKYKKKAEKGMKWRVVLRTIKEKKIA